MSLDSCQEIAGSPIMQEKYTLSHSPQWRRTELIATSQALRDVVSQTGTHVVKRKVAIRGVPRDCSYPMNGDEPVIRVGEWQRAHPTELNTAEPFCADSVSATGVGGAKSRMKAAKLTTSEAKPEGA